MPPLTTASSYELQCWFGVLKCYVDCRKKDSAKSVVVKVDGIENFGNSGDSVYEHANDAPD